MHIILLLQSLVVSEFYLHWVLFVYIKIFMQLKDTQTFKLSFVKNMEVYTTPRE